EVRICPEAAAAITRAVMCTAIPPTSPSRRSSTGQPPGGPRRPRAPGGRGRGHGRSGAGSSCGRSRQQGRLRAGVRGHLRRRHPRPDPLAASLLPQWSSREASAARYRLGGGLLRLVVEADPPPRGPEFRGQTRVSSLQTGVVAGPVGSSVGQSRFTPGLVVRQALDNARLYTPQYGLFELRGKAIDDPRCMGALWMIGYEDTPDRSAEICICEIFGRNMTTNRAGVGMGLHPFADPRIRDEFSVEDLAIDAREFHLYAAEWTPEHVAFFVDQRLVKVVEQSPGYPMQFMPGVYEFPDDGEAGRPAHPYPKEFVVDYLRGYRPIS